MNVYWVLSNDSVVSRTNIALFDLAAHGLAVVSCRRPKHYLHSCRYTTRLSTREVKT
jgi:hypothetical protein